MTSGNVARESQIEIQNNLQAHDLKASFLMNSKFYSFHLCIFPLTFLDEGMGEDACNSRTIIRPLLVVSNSGVLTDNGSLNDPLEVTTMQERKSTI